MNDKVPITFTEQSFALFDLEANAVLTTVYGNLAIFSTRAMALQWARTSKKRVEVRPVFIKPADN